MRNSVQALEADGRWPRDLIEGADLYAEVYGVHPSNVTSSEQMANMRRLRKIAEGAGIKKYPHTVGLWVYERQRTATSGRTCITYLVSAAK